MDNEERRPGKAALDTEQRDHRTSPPPCKFPILPLDLAKMLRPGTISHVYEVEGSVEDALMVELPEAYFYVGWDSMERFVFDQLKRTLVVILAPDEVPA